MIAVPAGVRLVDAIDDVRGIGLPLSCRGGRCGVCRVRVLSGAAAFEPASAREQESLRFAWALPDERHGCQLVVKEDEGEAELLLSGQTGA